ncbi:MAG TPA: hypothetical protein DGG95_10985 [Cytophagales bacterium]|jgi:Ca-activated chloride channel homolog|nr:hypothetical protein [Cytophagales bacterium]
MKATAILILGILLSIDPNKVSKINSLKAEAKKAYLAGDFKTAIEKYRYLKDSLGVTEEELAMNLANSYFQKNDTANAFNTYQPLTASSNRKIKSWSNQQLGVMANRQGKFEEALNHFKEAIKAEPENEQAKFNYEMVKKKLDEQKKQQNKDQNKDNKDKKDDKNRDQKNNKDQQNKDQQNKDQKDNQDQKDQQKKEQEKKDQKDQQSKDQKDKEQKEKEKEQQQKEQEKKDQQNKDEKNKPDPSLSEKLKDMKISEQKAKMILEAMKNQEVQYLQQNRRKATKPKDKGKPDW